MHSPSISASLLDSFLSLGLFLFFVHDSGKYGWQGLNPRSVCVMLLTVPAATCSLWPTAPPHILLLHVSGHPSIVRWLPTASVPHVCLWLDHSMTELEWSLTRNMSRSPNQHTVLPVNKVNLLSYSIFLRIFWLIYAVSHSWGPRTYFILLVAILNACSISVLLKGPRNKMAIQYSIFQPDRWTWTFPPHDSSYYSMMLCCDHP